MIERTIEKEVIKGIKNRPVVLITGGRQVGKSTLCFKLKRELGFNYVSLDDLRLREQAKSDPELFLETHKWPLIIDEVQNAPGLFDAIEAVVNKEKLENGSNYGMYVLTSSQSYELMKDVNQSLAGRVGIISMCPLSLREINNSEEKVFTYDILELAKRSNYFDYNSDILFEYITRGMYPELYANKELDTEFFYSSYLSTYIERDVAKIINIRDKLKFQYFMQLLASMTGQELVYETIARTVGVTIETIKSWISVLLAGDIIYLLKPYNELSFVKRIVKRPKLYFCDTGLACYLANLSNPESLKNSIFKGRFVETFIVNELKKSFRNNNKRENFFYYRDNNQNEIDLIILENATLHLIECKSGIKFTKSDIKAFKQLRSSSYQVGTSFVICNTSSVYKIDENVYAIPLSAI